jgi:hypothetical protein
VDKAVNEYFANNAAIIAGEEAQLISELLKDKNWTKGNPTDSDIQLAETLVNCIQFKLPITINFPNR